MSGPAKSVLTMVTQGIRWCPLLRAEKAEAKLRRAVELLRARESEVYVSSDEWHYAVKTFLASLDAQGDG